jgi:polyphosphate kinase
VEIDLIVRGQCGLVPGLRGISSRIRVRSIVGRFLEHSRIFYFENGGKPEIYLGSADWMPRNLYERVEVLFPLKDPQHCERVCNEILSSYLADTRKARILAADGTYSRPRAVRNGHGFSAQEYFMQLAVGDGDPKHIPALRNQGVLYTSSTMITPPVGDPEDESSLDTSNATV